MQVIDYKCPNCGSDMVFDAESGLLSCHSCGRTDDIKQMADPLADQAVSTDAMADYHCNSCGAVVTTDAETTATTCPFCGSVAVLGDRLSGKHVPAQVIPFAIGKEDAIKAFRKWCKNGLLTPKGFMTADRVKEMTGVYVPFWLYDVGNEIEVHAHGTKIRTYTQGDYRYTETQHYDVYRNIRLNYVKVPIDASEKMSDELMDKLEPFPYEQLKPFKTPYLAGYMAATYSYDDKELLPRMKSKISEYIESYIRSTMANYATVTTTDQRIDTQCKQAVHTLLPVWMVNYDYNKGSYLFAMNGQTGKVVGKPPISKAKVTAWFASITGASFLALKLIAWMMGGGFW